MCEELFKVYQKENIDAEVEQLFRYYRSTGYPNYDASEYDGTKILQSIRDYDESNILVGKDLKQTMHGCGFLWTYFPHWIDVPCGSDKALSEKWEDDERLRKLIYKTYRWQQKHGNGVFTVNRLRQNAKVYLCSQSVSNFRPTVAKYIYNTYGNKGVVWDMSSGYGGRLLGFMASDCHTYYGTEPAKKTYYGLLKLTGDLKPEDKTVHLLNRGSEVSPPVVNEVDLCFTSPPYFDTEKYSTEISQSFRKFPTPDEWLDGFLGQTIKNCHVALKANGTMVLNVANVKSMPNLESETVRIAEENGFELVDTLYLILSSIAGKGVKREPVFVFKKVEGADA